MVRKVAILAAGFFVLTVPAAMAAGTFDKPSVAANSDADLTLNVSVDAVAAYDERVVLEVPAGFRVLACQKTDGFSCTQSTAQRPSRTVLTWQRSAPTAPVPLATDHFPFRVHTIDRGGTYVFAVHQAYSDNTTADSSAKLAVTASAARPTTTATRATAAPVVRSASVAPARQPRATTATTEAAWLSDTDLAAPTAVELGRESPAHGSAPMVVAGVIAAAAACGVFWLRRRAAPAP